MSLKAKIEAVIYAAEEPVTLAQLAAIFAAEVPVPDAQLPLPESLDSALAATPEETESAGHEVTVIDESGDMMDIAPAIEEGAPRLSSEADDTVTVHAAEDSEATSAAQSAALMPSPREVRDYLRELVDELIADYNGPKSDRGIEIREIAGGYRMATKPEYHDAVRAFVKNLKPAMKLSQQALETLAVIAYKQPVTSPEIAEIRGVDSGGVLANLISRKLVTTAGRKQVIGRPILYKTTKEFLLGFGLKDWSELPSMEEFEKMAGELAASDALEAEAMNERAGLTSVPEDSEERVSTAQNELNGAPPQTAHPEAAPENVPQEQES
jgi:segregation and condensation protein B